MTDPKTSLRDIAEQACIFDRTHFDDDTAPAVDAILSNHERLPSDRKLVTRLRPRHAVALGFFEGYAKAAEIASVMRRNIKEQIGADPNRNLFGALADLVKERDELRKRVIVDIELPTADEIDNWIAIGESTGPIPEKGEGNIRDIVARNGLEYVVAQLKKRIPEQANIGIVKKPPPPPPPAAPPLPNELKLSTEIDDELAQAAADHANRIFGDKLATNVRAAMRLVVKNDWELAACGFVEGARWQLAQEITDELLLEAVVWANEFCGYIATDSDLENAKKSMVAIKDDIKAKWAVAVRTYVHGALRKARKP